MLTFATIVAFTVLILTSLLLMKMYPNASALYAAFGLLSSFGGILTLVMGVFVPMAQVRNMRHHKQLVIIRLGPVADLCEKLSKLIESEVDEAEKARLRWQLFIDAKVLDALLADHDKCDPESDQVTSRRIQQQLTERMQLLRETVEQAIPKPVK